MSSTITPNMQLIIPGVGTEDGPQYAEDINASLLLVDQHTHTAGSGVPITPSALNINTDLTFLSNNAIALRSVRFTAQASALALPSDLGCLYEAGVDLYYNDGAGNQIRLTQGGSIVGTAGSITGLPSGTASASYAGGTFTWQQATNTPALMDSGSVIIREPVLNGKGVTLQTTTALGSNYALTLPAIPAGSTKIMALDTSGNMSAPYTVDGSTITISANVIGVPNSGISTNQIAALAVTTAKIDNLAVTTGKIADGAVTPAKRSTAVVAQNSSSNIGTSASIANTITTSGRPVRVTLSVLGNGESIVTASAGCTLSLYRANSNFLTIAVFVSGNSQYQGFTYIDTSPPVATTTYDLRTSTGTLTANSNFYLSVEEL